MHHCNDIYIYIGLETGYDNIVLQIYFATYCSIFPLCSPMSEDISKLSLIFTPLCYLLGNDDNDNDSDLGWRPFPLTNCAHSLMAQSPVKGHHAPMVTALPPPRPLTVSRGRGSITVGPYCHACSHSHAGKGFPSLRLQKQAFASRHQTFAKICSSHPICFAEFKKSNQGMFCY